MNDFLLVLAGAISSIMIWLCTTKILVPKVLISPGISKIEIGGKQVYKIKILNTGYRSVYNISVFFRFMIANKLVYVQLADDGIVPVLKKRKLSLCKVKASKVNDKGLLLNIDVKTNCKIVHDRKVLSDLSGVPQEIHDQVEDLSKDISLSDIFAWSIFQGAEIILYGYDSFTGSPACFFTKYNKDSIEAKRFKKNSVKFEDSDDCLQNG